MSSWKITGQYMETCNCTFLCPCITSNLTAQPTDGACLAAIAMRIDDGSKDGVALSGLSFVVLLNAPGVMMDGNITVALVVDAAASDQQVEAITGIATGSAGGPMAALGPLVGRVAGVERRPIRFESDGLKHSVHAGELVSQACEGVASAGNPAEAICIDNTAHPVNARLSLARATRSSFHAFGIDWDDASGTRNGHFAPFSWSA
jgi:hypothetical protein